MSDDVVRLEFIANPTQRQFIESRAEADLFDCRKGEGKSAALCWAWFYYCKHNPGAIGVMIRDTFENLKRTTLAEFLQWFPDGVWGTWHAGDKCYTWDTDRTGLKGKLYFMGVEDEGDAGKIASMPLAFAGIDEPSPAAGSSTGVSEFIFDTVLAQLRLPGMKWYAVKLAQNNPDESHWTYRRFWNPGTPGVPDAELPPLQESGFRAWQPSEAENMRNLPAGYYSRMERTWAHRPDLLRRFVKGKHGYQQVGRPVTPGWSDELHLAHGLKPVKDVPLHLLWDGGLNPTCLITQITPLGDWLFLEAHVGEEIGMFELIRDVIKPTLAARFRGLELKHIGDPALESREQSSSNQSAARVIRKELGGPFIKGPIKVDERIEPLRSVLGRTRGGRGIVQVDAEKARPVWHALRGGYHFHISRTGQVGAIKKNIHSHPGDAAGYGAGVLFPMGQLRESPKHIQSSGKGGYFNTSPGSLIRGRRDVIVPKEARVIGGTTK